MQENNALKTASNMIRNSVTFKIISILILILILLIPSSMITSMIHEREDTKQSAVNEIQSKWGNCQTITGPVITMIPVDIYQKSTRTSKYALMFIVLTFMVFFIAEVMNHMKVHPIQYLLIGLAMTIFYSLLISMSEHLNFGLAYLISSLSVVVLISGYTKGILMKNRLAVLVGGVLSGLYAFLYILLQLEDYALVMGSVGLFLTLGAVMYLTRKIDWYNINSMDHRDKRLGKPENITVQASV